MPTNKDRVLFILAHQDDEYFAAPWILDEIAAGNAVACVYLTNGGSRTEPGVRDRESRGVLEAFGLSPMEIAFLGSANDIPDGALVQHLSQATALTRQWIVDNDFTIGRIYAPDYEGGHADHDAAHLVAMALALEYGAEQNAWGFSLYNACGCPRPIFRALRLLKRDGARSIRYSILTGWKLAMLCWNYPSQRRTWLGLFPESFIRRLFVRSEHVNRFDVERVTRKPHDGDLLYERLFGVNYADFDRAASPFRDELTG